MSNTNLILEALFTGADEAEIVRRDAIAPEIMAKEWVEEFLKRKDVKKNPDGSYDVKGPVFIRTLKLTKFPIRFNKVDGYFSCSNNQLTSLEGSPTTVGESFNCSNNHLSSLEGAPKIVNRDFSCFSNKKKFTEEEVRAVSDVKGVVFVD